MAYEVKTNLAKRKNYGLKRNKNKIKYIVWHMTGNDGDSDENNASYFKRVTTYTSAHYFVDSDSVTITVPVDYVAYSVGGKKQSSKGGSLYGKVTNTNSISIELCDDKKDGKVYPSEATIKNALELTKKLMKLYNIPASNVIRHYDVNGKNCPSYWCGTDAKNKKWQSVVKDKLVSTTSTKQAKKKTVTEIAKEVIAGKFGNGHATRKKKIEALGYNYEEVRKKVNELSKK